MSPRCHEPAFITIQCLMPSLTIFIRTPMGLRRKMCRGAKIHCRSAETCSFIAEHRKTDPGMDCTRDGDIHQEWPIKTEYVSTLRILTTHYDFESFPRLVVERIFHTSPRKLGRKKAINAIHFSEPNIPTLVNQQFNTIILFSISWSCLKRWPTLTAKRASLEVFLLAI